MTAAELAAKLDEMREDFKRFNAEALAKRKRVAELAAEMTSLGCDVSSFQAIVYRSSSITTWDPASQARTEFHDAAHKLVYEWLKEAG